MHLGIVVGLVVEFVWWMRFGYRFDTVLAAWRGVSVSFFECGCILGIGLGSFWVHVDLGR